MSSDNKTSIPIEISKMKPKNKEMKKIQISGLLTQIDAFARLHIELDAKSIQELNEVDAKFAMTQTLEVEWQANRTKWRRSDC